MFLFTIYRYVNSCHVAIFVYPKTVLLFIEKLYEMEDH